MNWKTVVIFFNSSIGFISAIMTITGVTGVTIWKFWSVELGIAVVILGALILAGWWIFFKDPKISNPPKIKDLKGYFAKLDRDFAEWKKLFVIDRMNNDFMPAYAEEIQWYVDLELAEQEKLRKGLVLELREQLIANQEWQMVLTGSAGIGKTTSLRYLVYQDRQAYEPGSPIPVYLELRYAKPNVTLKAWIIEQLRVGRLRSASHLPALVESWLTEGWISLFVDGWNELATELNETIFQEMQQFMQAYPKVFITITIRKAQPIFPNVPVFILQNMNKGQVTDFVKKNTDQPEKTLRQLIFNQIEVQPRFLDFITVPLYALMLVQVVRKEKTVPKRRAIIIKKFIDRLLLREEQKTGSKCQRHVGMGLESFRLLLSFYAYICVSVKKSQNTSAPIFQIQTILQQRQPNMTLEQTKNFLELAAELGLMVSDKDYYSFVHQEYLDYFAAEAMDMLGAPDES
jgi:predicted NACHT family NTPase